MQFAKYNASGNDFIIFHTFNKIDRSALAQAICDRQKGIGADGLIVLLPHDTYDFEWQFYNNNGSVASMCGNGTRACAHYAYTNGLASQKMAFLTGAGVMTSFVEESVVETELIWPSSLAEPFEENGLLWYFYDTGVPHLVTFVEDVNAFDKTIARQMRYKYNANVNFVSLENKSLHVRTYERGVEDETLACGTGMAAAYYGAWLQKLVDESAYVYPSSQEELVLRIDAKKLFFKGNVQHVFDVSWEYAGS
jgi:diaminopimelate epimerase